MAFNYDCTNPVINVYTHCRSSVRPTLAGGIFLCFLSFLRCCFQYEPYQFILNIEFISMKILTVCVCLIGASITAECIFSIVSYVLRLQFWTVLRRYRIILFRLRSFLVLLLTASAVANVVSLFIRVRDIWIQHMIVTIQVLQSVPSLLQVIHSLMQGMYMLYIVQ